MYTTFVCFGILVCLVCIIWGCVVCCRKPTGAHVVIKSNPFASSPVTQRKRNVSLSDIGLDILTLFHEKGSNGDSQNPLTYQRDPYNIGSGRKERDLELDQVYSARKTVDILHQARLRQLAKQIPEDAPVRVSMSNRLRRLFEKTKEKKNAPDGGGRNQSDAVSTSNHLGYDNYHRESKFGGVNDPSNTNPTFKNGQAIRRLEQMESNRAN